MSPKTAQPIIASIVGSGTTIKGSDNAYIFRSTKGPNVNRITNSLMRKTAEPWVNFNEDCEFAIMRLPHLKYSAGR
jgi:hypothetical protein